MPRNLKHPKGFTQNPIEEEIDSIEEEEAEETDVTEQITDEAQISAAEFERGAGVTEKQMPAEEVAIHTDNATAKKAETGVAKASKKKETKKQIVPVKAKKRGKKYTEANLLVDKNKLYGLSEAIDLVKRTAFTKFDSSIEVHIRLAKAKGKKTEEGLRGLVLLPHGAGKIPKIGILDEAMVDKIAKDQKIEFDIFLATPEIMPKVARIAKILGPKGKMPSPKNGTVTDDPEKTIALIKNGRVEYKTDSTGIIHQIIGKASWDKEKLEENFKALLSVFPKTRLQSVVLSATMGPGVKVSI